MRHTMKFLVFLAFTFIWVANQAFSQSLRSYNFQDNINLGIPIHPNPSTAITDRESKFTLDKPFSKGDLLQAPIFYSKKPSEMGLKFKSNPIPPMDFKMKLTPLPMISSRIPVKELDQSGNPTILTKPLH